MSRGPNTIDGKPIKNATRRWEVEITPKDARAGATKDPARCAAALACKHDIPDCSDARVHISTTYLKIKGRWLRFRTPAALRQEIVGFDRGTQFSPGVYTLRPLPPNRREAYGKRQGGPDNKPKKRAGATLPRRKRAAPHVTTGVRASPDYE
jgi:hypothetical protein